MYYLVMDKMLFILVCGKCGFKFFGEWVMIGVEWMWVYCQCLQEDQDFEVVGMLFGVVLWEKFNCVLLELECMEFGWVKFLLVWEGFEVDFYEGVQYVVQLVWQEVGWCYGFKLSKCKLLL